MASYQIQKKRERIVYQIKTKREKENYGLVELREINGNRKELRIGTINLEKLKERNTYPYLVSCHTVFFF